MTETPPRVRVYVDGFNLYYGALQKNPAVKWLDIESWASSLVGTPVKHVTYCTAKVTSYNDPQAPVRQEKYLQALTRPGSHVQVVKGKFSVNETRMPRTHRQGCSCCGGNGCTELTCTCCSEAKVRVVKVEEKGSDVNLAVLLVRDALKGQMDTAIVVSGDSDLQRAVDIARREGVTVYIAEPRNRRHSLHGNGYLGVLVSDLAQHQFPDEMTAPNGARIGRPARWK